MTWSSRVRVESQNLLSHFESLVFQLESNEIKHCHYYFFLFLHFFCFMKKNEMKISFFSNEILFL